MRTLSTLLFLLTVWGVTGCATNSLDYPGDGVDLFAENDLGKGFTIGVLRNAGVPEAEDENRWLFSYLQRSELFADVRWVDRPQARGCDYVVHCTISCSPHSALYREKYVLTLLLLGVPWLLGIPTHDSYAHYHAGFVVYRHGQSRHSYLLYNRRQYWWDNIYWRPDFHGQAAATVLFDGFLYLFGRDFRASVSLTESGTHDQR